MSKQIANKIIGISYRSFQNILKENLLVVCVWVCACTTFVPCIETEVQAEIRKVISAKLFE
jgi:hypothetical protein